MPALPDMPGTAVFFFGLLLVVLAAFMLLRVTKSGRSAEESLLVRLEALEKAQEKTERALREELAQNREEQRNASRSLREEVTAVLTALAGTLSQAMGERAAAQKDQLDGLMVALGRFSDTGERRLTEIRSTVEERLRDIQIENTRQIDQMRQTIDERLQGTLEKRLGESFRQVSERLEQVHRGLGEMQALAAGVGDLKKVLTNVKTRGIWGEVQLGAMLEQVLHPDQYAANVATRGGAERVEFAVRLPGQGSEADGTVWLPIDAKFPLEDYQRLLDAQERTDPEGAETAGRQLEQRVRSCARDIGTKYLNPPFTTDFAVLFLPVEGLFAEVVRRSGLVDSVQREHRVVIAGPTTLWALLNSLQMGFRTLAIEKRTSEVWNVLGAIKGEFKKFGEMIKKAQKKIKEAGNVMDFAHKKTQTIERKLREVQVLPSSEARGLLDTAEVLDGDDDPDETGDDPAAGEKD